MVLFFFEDRLTSERLDDVNDDGILGILTNKSGRRSGGP